jgi:hypothetical protein
MKTLTSPLFEVILGVTMIFLAFLPPYEWSTVFFGVAGPIWLVSGVVKYKKQF